MKERMNFWCLIVWHYIIGKLLLVELLVLYLFSTAADRIDRRYGGLIWCVILNNCISLWLCRLVLCTSRAMLHVMHINRLIFKVITLPSDYHVPGL